MNLREIVEWAARISWTWKALSPQRKLSDLVMAAVAYNTSLAGLLRAGAIPGLLVQSLEKTMIEYSGTMARKLHPLLSRERGGLAGQDGAKDQLGEAKATTDGEGKDELRAELGSQPQFGPPKKAEGRAREAIAPPIPNVGLLLHQALASRVRRGEEDYSQQGLDVAGLTFNQLADVSRILNAVKYIAASASLGSPNESGAYPLVSTFVPARLDDIRHDARPPRRHARDNAPFASKAKTVTRGSEERGSTVMPQAEKDAPPEILIRGPIRQPIEPTLVKGSPIEKAIFLQRAVAGLVSAVAPPAYSRETKIPTRKIPKARTSNASFLARDFKVVPLASYMASSLDASGPAVGENVAKLSPSGNSATRGRAGARRGTEALKSSSVGSIFSRVVGSLASAGRAFQTGRDLHLLPSVMHSLVAHSLISWRPAISASRGNALSEIPGTKFRTYNVGEVKSGPLSEQEISQVAESRMHHDLFDFSLALPYSSPVISSASKALSRSIRHAFGLQSVAGGPAGLPDSMAAKLSPGYTGPQAHTTREFKVDMGLSKDVPSQQSVAAGFKKRSSLSNLPIQSSGLAESPGERVFTSEQSGSSPVSNLQQVYSRYTLHNMIRRTKSGALLVATETPSQVPPPLASQRGRRPSAVSASRMQDGSDSLPHVTKLQTVLALHSVRKAGSVSGSMALLSPDHIVSTPVPSAPVMRGAAGSSHRLPGSLADHAEPRSGTVHATSTSKADSHEGSRFANRQPARSAGREAAYKPLSLRELRKMMEQIFQEELKRYGL